MRAIGNILDLMDLINVVRGFGMGRVCLLSYCSCRAFSLYPVPIFTLIILDKGHHVQFYVFHQQACGAA